MSKSLLSTRRPGFGSGFPSGRLVPRKMFDDLIDQFLADSGNEFDEVMNAAMDVAETDQTFEIKMDLPGVDSNDVDIQIDNSTLTVRGHRSEEKEEKNKKKQFHRVERFSGSFSRSVMLPNSINEDETVAEFKDGVLRITVPKSDDAKPRKIAIKD